MTKTILKQKIKHKTNEDKHDIKHDRNHMENIKPYEQCQKQYEKLTKTI